MTNEEYEALYTALVQADLPGHTDDTQTEEMARTTAALGGQALFYDVMQERGQSDVVCNFDEIFDGSITIVEGKPADDDERDALVDDLETLYAECRERYINERKEATTRSWNAGRGSDDRPRTLTSWLAEDGWYACLSGETVDRLGWETDDLGPFPTRQDAHEAVLDWLQGADEDADTEAQHTAEIE